MCNISVIVLAAFFAVLGAGADRGEDDQHHHFSNTWVVHVRATEEAVQQMANELGYLNKGQLKGFPDHFVLEKRNIPRKSKRSSSRLTQRLSNHPIVEWAEQMVEKRREKRGLIGYDNMIPKQEKRMFNDPLWTKQWYMHDTRLFADVPEIDLNIIGAWDLGYTGKGVVVSILDDGLEWNHTDIYKNYDPNASWDSNDNDNDPMARLDVFHSNAHGTKCAGEVAMVANNNKCGVGIAYNAKIGGIRMLDGPVSDAVEGVSLAFNTHYIDIYSASWGPTDDGKTLEGPGVLAQKALVKGITEGRNGKGVIYVWASGNGGGHNDNCNCDGYTSSIYTLSVGSASEHGRFPWYGEMCASTMASTYSSGAYSDQKISTADLGNKCTMEHTGTSASAPLAAGIMALVLEANGNITWRDAQHLVVWTSSYEALKLNHGWKRNARGFLYNTKFGFGLMNATAIVLAAKSWVNVPKKTVCQIKSKTRLPLKLQDKSLAEIIFDSDGCENTENAVSYLEHTQVEVTMKTPARGSLHITLTSPSGTTTTLLTPRKSDNSKSGFKNWRFMSIHLWGEQPNGEWVLKVKDTKKHKKLTTTKIIDMKLIFHGTKEMPHYMKEGPRKYMDERDVYNILNNQQNEIDTEGKFVKNHKQGRSKVLKRSDGYREKYEFQNFLDDLKRGL